MIESPFATVRLRQRVTKGAGSRTKGLLMAYKLLDMAQARWRRLDGAHLLPLVRAGITFMDGVQRFAIGGLTAATIVETLMPNYALGQQVSKTDDRIKASYVTVPSPQGNGSIKGYLVRPFSADTRAATVAKLP